MPRRFVLNAPSAVSEVIDGEAVIMNLETGHYFSAQGTGSLLWTWIEKGHATGEIAEAIAAKYGTSREEADAAVAGFVEQLVTHALVREEAPPTVPIGGQLDTAEAPPEWSPPVLNVFTDMEELLLLDPIHDVGEAGWPLQKKSDDHAA